MNFDTEIAGLLFRSNAVRFRDEGFALNIHRRYPDDPHIPRSPFYIDLRAPLRSIPQFRRRCTRFMYALMAESDIACHLLSDAPQAITPLVALLSDMTAIPMISPRLGGKDHGLENQIDGLWEAGQMVALIDDLLTTGDTLKQIIALYRRNGLHVAGCYTVIDRSNGSRPAIDGVPFFAGLRWSDMLEHYRSRRVISPEIHNRCVRYPAELQEYLQVHHPETA